MIQAVFSDKIMQGTGTYYLTLDPFGGTLNGEKKKLRLTSKSSEYTTVDLSEYTAVRPGYTFVDWAMDGNFVTSVDSSYFADKDAVQVTATYKKNSFDGDYTWVTLNANGGTIDGKASEKYDYVGGANSGTDMVRLPVCAGKRRLYLSWLEYKKRWKRIKGELSVLGILEKRRRIHI